MSYLSTRQLAAPIQHYAGDLVATIPAGATLADANAVLGRERQWLPLDPPRADLATIGGIVATNDSGPRRHHYGSARDLIIGVEFALADGRVAKAGGRVVKNVAGYDLARLLCGSFGSLALITSATFKLAPIAPFSITVAARPRDAQHAHNLALAVAAASLAPSAVDIEAPSPQLLVRFETTERAARQQADVARRLLDEAGAPSRVCVNDEETELWRRHERRVFGGGGMLVKLTVLPTDVAGVLVELDRDRPPGNVEWTAVGRGALGVLLISLEGNASALVDIVSHLRSHVSPRGGSLVVLEAPDEVLARVNTWGHVGTSSIMRAVKARFDPENVLSPGCGPGGL
jgi:glycolate oxidase FAD binding subunit